MRKPTEPISMQSATRALTLLRHIGAQHGQGVRLTDLIRLTGLDKSTIHRLLGCLMAEGFIEHMPGAKSYRLGLESAQLGLVSADLAPLVDRFRPLILKIARLSEETVFLIARSGHYALCVHREDSSVPHQVSPHSIQPGTRRVIGLSAAGLGILAQAPDTDLEATYRQNAPQYECVGASYSSLHKLIDTTRERGFSEMTSFGPMGSSGVGCVVPISDTTHVGISIAGTNLRMSPARRRELGLLLRSELSSTSGAAPSHQLAHQGL